MKSINISKHFNNKAYQKNDLDNEAMLTLLGTAFPYPKNRFSNRSDYKICYDEELDNFEAVNNIIKIEAKEKFNCMGIIALGLYGDYVEKVVVGSDRGEYEVEVNFPNFSRTSVQFENTSIFYTTKYVISQYPEARKIDQQASVFEMKVPLDSECKINYIKLPDNLCVRIFAITLF